MSIGLLGKKIGMTRVYDEKGKLRPVTVIAAGDNTLLRVKTTENDGYSARPGRLRRAEGIARHQAVARRFQEGRFGAEEARAGIPPQDKTRPKARSI